MYKNPTDYFMHVIATPSTAEKLAADFSLQVRNWPGADMASHLVTAPR